MTTRTDASSRAFLATSRIDPSGGWPLPQRCAPASVPCSVCCPILPTALGTSRATGHQVMTPGTSSLLADSLQHSTCLGFLRRRELEPQGGHDRLNALVAVGSIEEMGLTL